ncbi:MAG TPA: nucleotide exchange factor GrpE [Candidatus Acidoferrum sp.]|nr:nucleotide exchange factor GrpE [Candidatus Acidoferrum sp.]
MPKPIKKQSGLEQELAKLTEDLQRLQADFINYRRRVEDERKNVVEAAKAATIMKLLPVIDNIELATKHLPAELADNKWALGITGLTKSLEKSLAELNLTRINAEPGTPFDPNLHEAVMMDEESQGDAEVVAEELRPGYQLGTQVVRHTMVKVKRQPLVQ